MLIYCVSENEAAQDVVRSTPEDFLILFFRLKEKFQRNSEVEKEKLIQEFHSIGMKAKETLREYYMRVQSVVTELGTVFEREIPDEDLNRAFFKELPDIGKVTFVALQHQPVLGTAGCVLTCRCLGSTAACRDL